eukprot:12174389-Alexandrium_andersonii.AAC.1
MTCGCRSCLAVLYLRTSCGRGTPCAMIWGLDRPLCSVLCRCLPCTGADLCPGSLNSACPRPLAAVHRIIVGDKRLARAQRQVGRV